MYRAQASAMMTAFLTRSSVQILARGVTTGGLPTSGARGSFDSTEIHVGGDVECRSIIAPGDVGCALSGLDSSEQLSFWRKDVDAARTSGKQVAVLVYFQAVGRAGKFAH